MQEKWLFRFALVSSLIGILIVYYMSLNILGIGEVNEDYLDQPVRIKGYISNINVLDSFYLITVYDKTGEIVVIDFDKNSYLKGEEITIRGTVSEYDGELQLIMK